MKKIIAICSIMVAGLGILFATKATLKPAMAEGEEPAVTETIDYQDMYEKAVEKYNKISNYQVLGTTIGGLVATLAALGLTALHNKLNNGQLDRLYELSRKSTKLYEGAVTIVDETKKAYQDVVNEYIEFKEEAVEIIEGLKEEKDELKALLQSSEEARKEERKFFVTLICNNAECVANGVAEKIYKEFGDKLNG